MEAANVYIHTGDAVAPSPELYSRYPITYSRRTLGTLYVMWAPRGRPSDDQNALARMIAREFGVRLQLSSLQETAKAASQEMARKEFSLYTIYHVSKVLGGVLDIDEVLSLLTDTVAEVMTVRACYVMMQNEDHDALSVRGLRIPMNDVTPHLLSLPVSEKVPDWLASLGWEARTVRDFREPAFAAAFPGADRLLKAASIEVCVPLIHKNRLVGLMALDRKYTGHGFEQRDDDFLTILAPLAANALTNAQLYELAILDGLTRVYVVRYFKQRCREELKRSRRYNKPLTLIMWDIDHFKSVNDTYGHLVGDRVLHDVAAILKRSVRLDVDIVARYGGEEFVVLLPETEMNGAAILAERIRTSVEEHRFGQDGLHVTVSGGLCDFPFHAHDYAELIGNADEALFRAKRLGRNRICVAERGLRRGSA